MIWLYQSLNVLSTIVEVIGLYFISGLLLKPPRCHLPFYKVIPFAAVAVAALSFLQFASQLGVYRIPLLLIFTIAVLKIYYEDSVYQCIVTVELWSVGVSFLVEVVSYICVKLTNQNILVIVDGHLSLRWEVYAIVICARIIAVIVICILLRGFRYTIQSKDCLMMTIIFLNDLLAVLFSNHSFMNSSKAPDTMIYVISTVMPIYFLMIFLYSRNTLYLREQERQKQISIERMNQQLAYYQEKLKDEERVRSVYHDMKNYLLVLQRKINAPETAGMVEKLQSQVAVYEDYVHTGNDILDIILKEKSEIAREKQIALPITASLYDIDFIEPLDIITIFGNGLDNAIEASERLMKEERAILVKAGKVQNFLSILIENN